MNIDERLDQSIRPANCPFCASSKITFSKQEIAGVTNKFAYWLRCLDCQATGPIADNQKNAAQKRGLKSDI